MKFGISILAVALLLGGCAPKTLTDAEMFGANNYGLAIHAAPSGALIYGEDGTAWGVATEFAPHSGPGLWKTFHFSSAEDAEQGISTTITAVWASGAKSSKRLHIAISSGSQWGSWTFSRPMDVPGLDIDLRTASQIPPQSQDQNFNAADALAAFGRGLAQSQAARGSQAPVATTCIKNGVVVNCLS